MKDKTYTILELSEKLNQSKQAIRRRIDRIGLKSINRNTREFPNEPLEYNIDSYTELADSFGVSLETKKQDDDTQRKAKRNASDTQNKSEINLSKDKIIEILERELKHSKEKLSKAENEKEKLFQLLDQQQQLSLNDKNMIQKLEVKVEDVKDKEEIKEKNKQKGKTEQKKNFFSRLFNI